MNADNLTPKDIAARAAAPTPKFFKKLRRVFVLLGAIGGTILTMGPAAPAVLVAAAPWLVTGGAVGASVASLAKDDSIPEGGQ